MGKEVRMSEYGDDGEDAGNDVDTVPEWEIGLPSGDDLTPLSQSLIPPMLALAFSIIPERSRTIQDVNRASQNTLSLLRSNGSSGTNNASSLEEVVDRVGSISPGSDPKKQKKSDGGEAVDSMVEEEGDSGTEDASGKTQKRPRLVWTPQLHKRFVQVVAHLGVKNAVPKTIMQLMNVEGLTRENVASHLQKYRLYLKRIQGLTTEGPSSSDQLFSSTPVPPQSFQDGGGANGSTGKLGIPIPVPSMMPMPVYVHHHMGMQGYNHSHDNYHHQYHHHGNESNTYMMQQSKFGSMATSPSVGGGGVNDK